MEAHPPRKPLPDALDLATALRRVLGSGEIDCETKTCPDVLRMIDEYVEMLVRGEGLSSSMSIVEEHLEECPDCCAECEALLRILELEQDE